MFEPFIDQIKTYLLCKQLGASLERKLTDGEISCLLKTTRPNPRNSSSSLPFLLGLSYLLPRLFQWFAPLCSLFSSPSLLHIFLLFLLHLFSFPPRLFFFHTSSSVLPFLLPLFLPHIVSFTFCSPFLLFFFPPSSTTPTSSLLLCFKPSFLLRLFFLLLFLFHSHSILPLTPSPSPWLASPPSFHSLLLFLPIFPLAPFLLSSPPPQCRYTHPAETLSDLWRVRSVFSDLRLYVDFYCKYKHHR